MYVYAIPGPIPSYPRSKHPPAGRLSLASRGVRRWTAVVYLFVSMSVCHFETRRVVGRKSCSIVKGKNENTNPYSLCQFTFFYMLSLPLPLPVLRYPDVQFTQCLAKSSSNCDHDRSLMWSSICLSFSLCRFSLR